MRSGISPTRVAHVAHVRSRYPLREVVRVLLRAERSAPVFWLTSTSISASLITRIALQRKSGCKPSPTLRTYSSSAHSAHTHLIGHWCLPRVDRLNHEEAPMTVRCQSTSTPRTETLSRLGACSRKTVELIPDIRHLLRPHCG